MSSIRRSDPEYQQAMREAKELFDAAMAKSSTKGRVGRPKTTPAPAAVAAAAEVDADDLAEISELEEIVEVEAAALAADGAEDNGEAMGDATPAGDGATPPARGGARKLRRATDG